MSTGVSPTTLQTPVPFRSRSPALRVAVAGLLLALYIAGAVVQGFRVNLDPHRTDQAAYMEYARRMATTGYSYVGDRARMPVYPFLLSLLYRPGMSEEELFRRGKAFNIALSVLLLALTGAILRKWLGPLPATTIVLVAGFTVFMFKAGYVQCELLFYFLSLALFVLMVENLLRPSLPRTGLAGLVAALTYLTKASVLPAIVLYLAALLGALWIGARRGKSRRETIDRAAGAALFLAVFLAAVAPYILTSKRVFGRYFHNVASTFYLWYDSWEEVERGTKAHGDRVGWPRMPAGEIPSARRYWREHSLSQIAGRLGNGLRTVVGVAASSYGYLKYAALYLLALLLYSIRYRRHVARLVRGPAVAAVAFVVLYFTGYLLLYAWYTPIADGNRLTLSLFLPGLAAIGYFLGRMPRELPLRVGRLRITTAGVHLFAIAVLSLDLVFQLPRAISRVSGAD